MPNAEDMEAMRRLSALYAEQSDEVLVELRKAFDGLTDGAQGALRDEMMRRGIWAETATAQAQPKKPLPPIDDDFYDHLRLGGVEVCSCDSTEEGNLVRFVLGREKIASALRQNQGRFDLHGPKVVVAPDDLENARAILAQGISEELREEFGTASVEEAFQEPECPHCGSSEILLESVEPTNQWLCEACEGRWEDEVVEEETSK